MRPYADEQPESAARRWRRPVFVGAAATALGVFVLVAWGRSGGTVEPSPSMEILASATAEPLDQCSPPATKPAKVSPSDIAHAEAAKERAEVEFARTGGWTRIKAPDFRTGAWVCGWNKGVDSSPAGDVREGLYDAPSGQLRGYVYPAVGFVDVQAAAEPGFDAKAERLRVNGCDPMADRTCRPAR